MQVERIGRHGVFCPDGFPVAVIRHRAHTPTRAHSHDFTELVVVTGGSGLHVTGREQYPISRGDVYVISGRRSHEYRGESPLSLVNILFDSAELELPAADLRDLPGYHALFTLEPAWRRRQAFAGRLRLQPEDLARVEGMLDQLERELSGRKPGYRFMCRAMLMQLIGYLSRCYTNTQADASRKLIRIGEAISFLESRVEECVRLRQLASIARMSVRHFQRAFRDAMGMSPIEHLIRLRVARGADLLRTSPELSITEIGFRSGFQDSNYFSRQFRRVMGCTPRECRRRQ